MSNKTVKQKIQKVRRSNLPAFLAARRSSSSIKCWAGSPSGNFSMKLSTWETTSSLFRYWYKPSDERIRNWSLGHNLWWRTEGKQDMYGAVPINSLRNISSTASFNFGYRKINIFQHVRQDLCKIKICNKLTVCSLYLFSSSYIITCYNI